MKRALITGITGQDGAYLADFLLKKGYEVHGIKRRASSFNTARVDHLYHDPHEQDVRFFMHYGDLTDSTNLIRIIQEIQPHEVYNLGAQSHVKVSFETPEYTANVDGLGALRILEAIRILKLEEKTRFYQASTSELFGNGILFNHESPVRGETFVIRKITRALARIKIGLQDTLYLGNLNARRDWGHARDFVEMQWLMLQQDEPEDYVIATGIQYSVKELVEIAAEQLGISIRWEGEGQDEKGIAEKTGQIIVAVDPGYYRPTEVNELLGDAGKARKKLGWEPGTSFEEMIAEMVEADMEEAQKDYWCQTEGFQTFNHFEP